MLHNIIAIPVAVGPNSPFADVCDDLTSFTLQTACDYQGRYIVIHKDGIAAQSRKRATISQVVRMFRLRLCSQCDHNEVR